MGSKNLWTRTLIFKAIEINNLKTQISIGFRLQTNILCIITTWGSTDTSKDLPMELPKLVKKYI